jgi:hypothetical protein
VLAPRADASALADRLGGRVVRTGDGAREL